MARSAHAFTRGSTARFYQWLTDNKPGSLPEGQPVWICGDCHTGNLGPIGGSDGGVKVLIRDLDQTVIGNPVHDLIRLGLSLATAVRDSDLPGGTTVIMLESMVEGYQRSFGRGRNDVVAPPAVAAALQQALSRRWKHLARERLEDETPSIPLGKCFWPLSKGELSAVETLVATEEVRHLVTLLKHRADNATISLLDAAYWMKGCSSLGGLRYAVLVGVGEPPYAGGSICLLDIKEAATAAAPRTRGAEMPRTNGERIVTGANHLSPLLGERMRWSTLLGKSVFVRELLPQDLKLTIDRLSEEEAVSSAHFLAGVIGRAHAAQMDVATRRSWVNELKRNRSKSLDAPGWFWRSVVDLIGVHEVAYLDHCRRCRLLM